MSDSMQQLMKEAASLPVEDQLRLAAYLVEQVRQAYAARRSRRKWQELCGMAPDLLAGEDAQEWVSRNRREADEQREAQWRG